MAGDECSIHYRPGVGDHLGLAQLILPRGVGNRLVPVQQAPAGDENGAGAQSGQPDPPAGGLLDEGGHPLVVPETVHAPLAAGQDNHLRLVQVHLGELQIGADRNVVAAGDRLPGQRDQGGVHLGLPEQVGGDQSLRLLEAGGKQNVNHRKTSLFL